MQRLQSTSCSVLFQPIRTPILGSFNTRGDGATYSCTTAIPNLTTCFYGIYLFQPKSENLNPILFTVEHGGDITNAGFYKSFFKFFFQMRFVFSFLHLQQFHHAESVASLSFPVAE